MTGFNTQVDGVVYRIQFETDNQRAYKVVQAVIRSFVDLDNANEVDVSKMEKTTHTEECSVCNCEALGTEVQEDA